MLDGSPAAALVSSGAVMSCTFVLVTSFAAVQFCTTDSVMASASPRLSGGADEKDENLAPGPGVDQLGVSSSGSAAAKVPISGTAAEAEQSRDRIRWY